MAEFLTDEALTEAIRYVVGGKGVKCAVAFWGNHGFFEAEALGGVTKDWQIICDIQMGGTSRDALEKLGAPTEPNLKFRNGLHAKVYISDRGVVVGSANASAGGLGFDGKPARLLEAATFYEPNSEAGLEALQWFERIFEDANEVDDAALREAEQRYRRPMIINKDNSKQNSFLQSVAACADQLEGVSFAITRDFISNEAVTDSALNIEVADPELLGKFRDWKPGPEYVFVKWPYSDIDKGAKTIVEFYIERNGKEKKVFCHQVYQSFRWKSDPSLCNIYTEQSSIVHNGMNMEGPEICKQMTENDWKALLFVSNEIVSKKMQRSDGDGIFSADEFSTLLGEAYRNISQ